MAKSMRFRMVDVLAKLVTRGDKFSWEKLQTKELEARL